MVIRMTSDDHFLYREVDSCIDSQKAFEYFLGFFEQTLLFLGVRGLCSFVMELFFK